MTTYGIDKPSFMIVSKDRINGTDGAFSIKLPLHHDHTWDQMALVSAVIPKSYYTINEFNNVFELYENTAVSANPDPTYQITIPSQNYNAYDFSIVLKNLLAAQSVVYGNFFNYIVDYNQDTLKFTIQCDSSGSVIVMRDKNPHRMFGLANNSENSFVLNATTGFYDLISTQQVMFQATRYITVKCDLVYDSGRVGGDITTLARIPIENTMDGGYINYSMISLEESSRSVHEGLKSQVYFSLYDDNENIINFNGHYVTLLVMFFSHNKFYETAVEKIEYDTMIHAENEVNNVNNEEIIRILNEINSKTIL